jgi:vitamin B12 transporter
VFDTVHNWLPNANLKPETGSAWTAGLDVEVTPGLTGQFTYFGNSLNDRLGIIAGRWTNIGLVNTNGLEAALRWKLSPEWSTSFSYTYTDARIATGVETGLQLSTVPFSVAQLGIGYSSAGWQVNLYANYHSGARRALFTTAGVSTTEFSPSFFNLDLNARVPLGQTMGLLIGLENLTGVSYEKVNRIYQPGLTFRIGVQTGL